MFCGLPFGMMAERVSYDLDTLTPADIAAITGKPSPTLMWRGNDATGALDLVGSDDLSDANTPTKLVSDTTLGGTVTQFTDNTDDGMDAASNTVADVGIETITVMVIMRVLTLPGGNRDIVSKIPAGPPNGWELYGFPTGGMAWSHFEASGTIQRLLAVNHGTTNGQVLLSKRSITDNEAGIWTREGSTTGNDGFGETLSNTAIFSVGDSVLRNCAGMNVATVMLWIGSDGDGFGETERLAVAQALGIEP